MFKHEQKCEHLSNNEDDYTIIDENGEVVKNETYEDTIKDLIGSNILEKPNDDEISKSSQDSPKILKRLRNRIIYENDNREQVRERAHENLEKISSKIVNEEQDCGIIYKKGEKLVYGETGQNVEIEDVHMDPEGVYYTIKLDNNNGTFTIKQTTNDKLMSYGDYIWLTEYKNKVVDESISADTDDENVTSHLPTIYIDMNLKEQTASFNNQNLDECDEDSNDEKLDECDNEKLDECNEDSNEYLDEYNEEDSNNQYLDEYNEEDSNDENYYKNDYPEEESVTTPSTDESSIEDIEINEEAEFLWKQFNEIRPDIERDIYFYNGGNRIICLEDLKIDLESLKNESKDEKIEYSTICPKGHNLYELNNEELYNKYYCDLCGKYNKPDIKFMGCDICNWDICKDCIKTWKGNVEEDLDSDKKINVLEDALLLGGLVAGMTLLGTTLVSFFSPNRRCYARRHRDDRDEL